MMRSSTDTQDVLRRAQDAGLRQIRFTYCDTGGVIRAKSVHMSSLPDRIVSGVGLTLAMQAMTAQDELAVVDGMGPVGEVRLVPDPDTFSVLPDVPNTGAMLVDMQTLTGIPWEACPRAFLKSQLKRLDSELGAVVRSAFEAEFSLASLRSDGCYVPIDDSRCFSTTGMNAAADVIDEVLASLESQQLSVEQYYAELGHGQHELSLRHAEGLAGADQQVMLRETIRGVAMRRGLVASFAPKPWADQAGNGAHLHFSLWSRDGQRNLFAGPADDYGLSTMARHFCAGILAHLPAIVAISCASVNSYRRLQPGMWSSAFSVWGPDNREAAIRVPSPSRPQEAGSTNLELKCSDATGNPYLVLGAVIACGLDGVGRQLELVDPVLVDPATLTDAQRGERGVLPLPRTLEEALDALECDSVLQSQLPKLLMHAYTSVKHLEVEHFKQRDVAYELAEHFAVY
jgi:glutamine synthetase